MAARSYLKRFWADERGATAIEYGLLVALLSILLVASYGNLQATLIRVISDATDKVAAATP